MNYIEILQKLKADTPLSKKELEALLAWLLSDEGKHSVEKGVLQEWNAFETSDTYDYRQLLNRVNRKIDALPASKRTPFRKYVRYALEVAAVVLLVVGISLFMRTQVEQRYQQYVETRQPEKVEIYNPKGLRTTIVLPDSSKVTMNADSRIVYLKDFLPNERSVTLSGEAFFEVAKDAARPFIVHANTARLTVLGTSFNVRSYPESEYIETTLLEGSLQVGAGKNEYTLIPGSQSRIHKTSQANSVKEVNTADATGWLKGALYFQLTPFSEMVAMLERAFSVNIRVENNALLQKNFTGRFEHGESIEQILEVLNLSVAGTSTYDKRNNTIIIR